MNLYYSLPLNQLTDSEGNPLQAVPEFAYGDAPVVIFTALGSDNAPVDLSSAVKWRLAIDVDRVSKTKPVIEVLPANISYNTTAKTLSYLMDTRTLEFFSSVDGKNKVALIAELCGYDSSNTRLFRFSWNMTGLMPVGGGEIPEAETGTTEYSAFEVYANAEAIPAGTEHAELGHITVAIPAQMTEKFTIRSNCQHANSDVIVDWGDGVTSSIRKSEFESEDLKDCDKEHQFEVTTLMTHTYALTGKYIIKVYGRKYFHFSHGAPLAQTNNLMCRCLETDLPLAGNVNNLAYFAVNALRLVNVCIPTSMDFRNIENFDSLFQHCKNLQYAYGLKCKIKIARSSAMLFYQCSALIQTDFVLPVCSIETSGEPVQCFTGCASLITPIQNLLPTAGFCNRIMNVQNLFNGCGSLTGTVPGAIFWGDTSKVWQNISNAFSDASAAVRAQVPTSWGGTNSSIIVVPEDSDILSGTGASLEQMETFTSIPKL